MSKFDILLDDSIFESEGEQVVLGSINIGDFQEKFYASLSYWDRNQYLSQWKLALERVLNGEPCSALVTTMYDPSKANFIFWWVLYVLEDEIYIQNHTLFLDEVDSPFNEFDLYSSIPDRKTQTEEGESISEWKVKMSAVKEFYDCYEVNDAKLMASDIC
ncbi:hypothetical protein [Psychromonas sp. Urea-02u-13]|uniref:hypothetical protein n=1 Tax=Psychromonas sp. Urea-02u-13 TaxID=2058326 RepID=UPI000C338E99|nr:hypothetical protein [Psychromonas sp. Urea-02u-13]PKG37019.1 hypothetical protein CXF74_21100 [Psychromonas sp. Urea-02u-13]